MPFETWQARLLSAICLAGAFHPSIFLPVLRYSKAGCKCGKQALHFIIDMAAGSADLTLGVFLTPSLTLAHIPAPGSWWHLLPTDWSEQIPSAFTDGCLSQWVQPQANPCFSSSWRLQCLQPLLVNSFPRLNSYPEKLSPHTVSSLVFSCQWATVVNPLSVIQAVAFQPVSKNVGFNWRKDEWLK